MSGMYLAWVKVDGVDRLISRIPSFERLAAMHIRLLPERNAMTRADKKWENDSLVRTKALAQAKADRIAQEQQHEEDQRKAAEKAARDVQKKEEASQRAEDVKGGDGDDERMSGAQLRSDSKSSPDAPDQDMSDGAEGAEAGRGSAARG